MRKIREVLRLYFAAALSIRAIARSLGTSPSTVGEHLRRAKVAGVSWPVPEALDDVGLERRLFPALPSSHTSRPLPDWSEVRRELRGKNVTLALLWQEYKAIHPEGLQYSRFCEQYREWAGKLDLVMRQEHRAGEKLFIDYAGQTVPVVDPETGEVRQAQVFVAVLGASSYTFAEATWTQSLPDWTASHVRAFEFYGGCPELVIPDNLRSGVNRAHRYEPDLNPTYHDLARHYGVAVLPTRVRRPRDKVQASLFSGSRRRSAFKDCRFGAPVPTSGVWPRVRTRPSVRMIRGTRASSSRTGRSRGCAGTWRRSTATGIAGSATVNGSSNNSIPRAARASGKRLPLPRTDRRGAAGVPDGGPVHAMAGRRAAGVRPRWTRRMRRRSRRRVRTVAARSK